MTKPEKRVEAMDSSQSESEEPAEAKSGRGRKRKSEDTPTASEKKAKKGKAKKGGNLQVSNLNSFQNFCRGRGGGARDHIFGLRLSGREQ